MRWFLVIMISFVMVGGILAQRQKPPKLNPRFGYEFDTDGFPQGTPKDTLTSVVKAIDKKRVDYLLAHLADPVFVDERVEMVYGGKFGAMVDETLKKLLNDPDSIKMLRRFLKEGTFTFEGDNGEVSIEGVKDKVFFRRFETRWFLENRKRGKPAPPPK